MTDETGKRGGHDSGEPNREPRGKQGAEREKKEKQDEQRGRPANQREQDRHQQDLLDEGIEESFPASDTPSVTRIDKP